MMIMPCIICKCFSIFVHLFFFFTSDCLAQSKSSVWREIESFVCVMSRFHFNRVESTMHIFEIESIEIHARINGGTSRALSLSPSPSICHIRLSNRSQLCEFIQENFAQNAYQSADTQKQDWAQYANRFEFFADEFQWLNKTADLFIVQNAERIDVLLIICMMRQQHLILAGYKFSKSNESIVRNDGLSFHCRCRFLSFFPIAFISIRLEITLHWTAWWINIYVRCVTFGTFVSKSIFFRIYNNIDTIYIYISVCYVYIILMSSMFHLS